ncbi:probable BOI-related E3 ubiquitin-protein ligase 2 [Cynara cardunculus var. scolymus]|uniref:probable BOI-related E3 ubiquitin-protein ligase 2 n=1 Tax=Cynara cardunculus var. scolymus TaxID=59895 RepID=UPI000D630556|nr:probable BOI-related E3 ubiquitin-protein ligase 2 [Cynara cardunculus var. scolymus]
MAVQAQLYSDYYQNNNNMGFANLPQDWVLMTGSSVFGIGDENRTLCSYEQPQDQRFLESQKIMNSSASPSSPYHNLVSSSLVSSSSYSRRNGMIGFQNLSSELERQRLEMGCFLHFQNEKLKAVLNEETRRREVILMQNYESKMKSIMDAKDDVLNTATNRTRELQNCLLMAEKEAKDWEKKAIENEAMVTDLNRKLNQARERKHEDAESVCNGGDDDDDEEEERERQKKMVCKACHVRSSCILLLPCRHLCCCRTCEGLLMFCPVCETVKNGSLEVFFGLN